MYRDRLQERNASQFVARPAVRRNLDREQEEKVAVLELLAHGPARVEDIAERLQRGSSSTHEVIRRLRDEDKVHGDGGYWVLGPRKNRRW